MVSFFPADQCHSSPDFPASSWLSTAPSECHDDSLDDSENQKWRYIALYRQESDCWSYTQALHDVHEYDIVQIHEVDPDDDDDSIEYDKRGDLNDWEQRVRECSTTEEKSQGKEVAPLCYLNNDSVRLVIEDDLQLPFCSNENDKVMLIEMLNRVDTSEGTMPDHSASCEERSICFTEASDEVMDTLLWPWQILDKSISVSLAKEIDKGETPEPDCYVSSHDRTLDSPGDEEGVEEKPICELWGARCFPSWDNNL